MRILLFLLFAKVVFACLPGEQQSTNGSLCYGIVMEEKYFHDAETDCQQRGGHLASVFDAYTNQLILKLAQTALNETGTELSYWLGGYKPQSLDWRWTNGAWLEYTNWDGTQPDYPNWNVNQVLKSGKWLSTDGSQVQKYYICEFPSDPSQRTTPPTSQPQSNCNPLACKYAGINQGKHNCYCCGNQVNQCCCPSQ